MADISRILIANRGEIAVRIIGAARLMGIGSVAVYSEADAAAPHVRFADEAVCIGPAPAGESYLCVDALLKAAKDTGADAIHPGYGFLSENAGFASAVLKAGLVFIGPSAKAIEQMGDKARAKRLMQTAGVPCIPGYEGEDQSDEVLIAEGVKVGFPLMVKAAAGGGGRGMRLVADKKSLADAISLARSEAASAFGDGTLILERALNGARHVEVQVLADSHGNIVHLGERDCSVQRRHQKVIEESPCPVVDEELRQTMGTAAVEAARSIDYQGAGTVEFLLDDRGGFHFLEMNTRLQVEHPVTEAVTGLDLVEQQIRIARGEPLSFTQEDVWLDGHAIEVRLYAEDPEAGFLPATGSIVLWREADDEGLRIDSGIATGQEITPFYDPMLAKVIARGPTRDIARRRLIAGLKNTALFGPRNNRDFLIACLQADVFADGEATTAFIEQVFGDGGVDKYQPTPLQWACLSALFHHSDRQEALHKALPLPRELENFTTAPDLATPYRLTVGPMVGGFQQDVRVIGKAPELCEVTADGEAGLEVRCRQLDEHAFELELAGRRLQVLCCRSEERLHASIEGHYLNCANALAMSQASEEVAGSGRILSPMHGRILEVCVESGQKIAKGERLAVLEAMKMQHEILADLDGTVAEVAVKADQQITTDDLMVVIEPD